MRVDKGRARGSINPWAPADLEILREHFSRAGPAGCQRYLPGRELAAISARANKLGLRYRPLRRDARVANLEKTGGPGRYIAPWQPLPKQERLPVRNGSMEAFALPSLHL